MIIDLLKITIPALIVFLATYFLVAKLLKEETSRRRADITLNNQRITIPIRMQAYERITLYLERISPESLLLRVNQPGLTAQKLHAALVANIRAEWEHNLSQQLYVSNGAWERVKNAKANVIKLISMCAEKVNPDDPAMSLSKLILESLVELEHHPTAMAIDFLKKELSEIF
jgi:hypothetical protein